MCINPDNRLHKMNLGTILFFVPLFLNNNQYRYKQIFVK